MLLGIRPVDLHGVSMPVRVFFFFKERTTKLYIQLHSDCDRTWPVMASGHLFLSRHLKHNDSNVTLNRCGVSLLILSLILSSALLF